MTAQIFDYYMTALTTPYCSIQPMQSIAIAVLLLIIFAPILWLMFKH